MLYWATHARDSPTFTSSIQGVYRDTLKFILIEFGVMASIVGTYIHLGNNWGSIMQHVDSMSALCVHLMNLMNLKDRLHQSGQSCCSLVHEKCPWSIKQQRLSWQKQRQLEIYLWTMLPVSEITATTLKEWFVWMVEPKLINQSINQSIYQAIYKHTYKQLIVYSYRTIPLGTYCMHMSLIKMVS